MEILKIFQTSIAGVTVERFTKKWTSPGGTVRIFHCWAIRDRTGRLHDGDHEASYAPTETEADQLAAEYAESYGKWPNGVRSFEMWPLGIRGR